MCSFIWHKCIMSIHIGAIACFTWDYAFNFKSLNSAFGPVLDARNYVLCNKCIIVQCILWQHMMLSLWHEFAFRQILYTLHYEIKLYIPMINKHAAFAESGFRQAKKTQGIRPCNFLSMVSLKSLTQHREVHLDEFIAVSELIFIRNVDLSRDTHITSTTGTSQRSCLHGDRQVTHLTWTCTYLYVL